MYPLPCMGGESLVMGQIVYNYLNKKKRTTREKLFSMVEVTGLEPATAWSQTRNATNCATPRSVFASAKVHIIFISTKFYRDKLCIFACKWQKRLLVSDSYTA